MANNIKQSDSNGSWNKTDTFMAACLLKLSHNMLRYISF